MSCTSEWDWGQQAHWLRPTAFSADVTTNGGFPLLAAPDQPHLQLVCQSAVFRLWSLTNSEPDLLLCDARVLSVVFLPASHVIDPACPWPAFVACFLDKLPALLDTITTCLPVADSAWWIYLPVNSKPRITCSAKNCVFGYTGPDSRENYLPLSSHELVTVFDNRLKLNICEIGLLLGPENEPWQLIADLCLYVCEGFDVVEKSNGWQKKDFK